MRERLVAEVGGKCANPGCAVRLLEIHHIREWLYQTHDEKHMIALCASCHDAVTRGVLRLDDETLYRWKSLVRGPGQSSGHLYVEPGGRPRLLIGSITAQGDSELIIFDLRSEQELSFQVREQVIMHLNATLLDLRRNLLLRVVDNHVFDHSGGLLRVMQRPGKIRVTAPLDTKLFPLWALNQVRVHEPFFPGEGVLTLLDLEVLEPNLVRVQGLWMHHRKGILITDSYFAFLDMQSEQPGIIIGAGVNTILNYTGPITEALFSMG
jgi:HNH endonuclease